MANNEWSDTPAAIDGWDQFLEDFNERVWPVFAKYGFSKNSALIAYQTNRLYNEISELIDALEDPE